MEGASESIVARLRLLSARKLGFDDYAREVTALVDEHFGIVAAADDWATEAWESADLRARLQTLRPRLEVLERKVAELEALK